MTDQEINEAIAVACGWSAIRWNGAMYVGMKGHEFGAPQTIPYYATDLNAIADAIKTLRYPIRARFNQWYLEKYKDSIEDIDPDEMPGLYLCNLDARELCEAFLYAHNLWRDE